VSEHEAQVDWLPTSRIAELQAHIKEHWRRGHPLAHEGLLRWQYRFPGDSERLSVVVAREGGQIVGVLGVIVVSFCVRGRRCTGGWLATWTVTPAARKRQVGLRLLRHVLEEPFGFVGVTAANEIALRIYRALGFSINPSIPRWVQTISSDALSTLLGSGAPPCAEQPKRRPSGDRAPASGEPPAQPPAGSSLRISSWSEGLAERWDETWGRQFAPQLIGTWRDAAYLRWRYLEHPRFAYAVRVAQDAGGSLRGLAVHRIADVRGAEGGVARVVELLGDPEAATALVRDVIAAGARAEAAFAEFYCSAAAVAEPLGECGFTLEAEPTAALPALFEPLNFGMPMLSGAFSAGAELGGDPALFDSDALYVTRSDGDADRPNEAI
jgi:ribosomal protein S18 acetylase RimI-like enzyme